MLIYYKQTSGWTHASSFGNTWSARRSEQHKSYKNPIRIVYNTSTELESRKLNTVKLLNTFGVKGQSYQTFMRWLSRKREVRGRR